MLWKKKLILARLLGRIITFLFPADLDENGILRSSCSEDKLEEI